MKIEKHISALLFRYQCVIIPGFGALLSEIKSSYYSPDKQCFYPPQKSLSFNVNIKHNDGLLANHLAVQEKISYEEAVLLITNEIIEWNFKLNSNSTIDLTNVGIFKNNSEGGLVFEPISTSNYLKTSFGLSTITVNAIERKILTPLVEPLIPSSTKKNKVYNFLKYAAVLTVFLSTSSILINHGYEAYLNDQSYSVIKTVQGKVQDKIQQATFIIEPAATTISIPVKEEVTEVVTTVNNTPYHIIACAFRSEKTSKTEAIKLKNKGFKNAIALPRTKYGVYPVSYGGHPSQTEAQKEMRKIHNTSNIDAWILVQ